ncbi:MAG: hypothetical protein ACE5I2_10970 [Anaerolineae bacterium]
MSTITVQLPEALAESLRREVLPPDKAIIKALEEWLQTRRKEQRKRARQVLLDKGLIMSPDEQQTFTNAIRARLSLNGEPPSLEEVEKSLAKLEPPLSEEIIVGRGKR